MKYKQKNKIRIIKPNIPRDNFIKHAKDSLSCANLVAHTQELCNDLWDNNKEVMGKLFNDYDLIDTALLLLNSNLNVSEAAKQGFMHRNTLMYRLGKIKKITGFNIKDFYEAGMFFMLIEMHKHKNKPLEPEINNDSNDENGDDVNSDNNDDISAEEDDNEIEKIVNENNDQNLTDVLEVEEIV